MTRALRRHHRTRMRARAARKLLELGMDGQDIDRLAPRLADNMRACSCGVCTWRRDYPRPAQQAADIGEREQRVDPEGDLHDAAWLAVELGCPCCSLWQRAATA